VNKRRRRHWLGLVAAVLCAAGLAVGLTSRTWRVCYLAWRATMTNDEDFCVALRHLGAPAEIGPVYWDGLLLPQTEIRDGVRVTDEIAVVCFVASADPVYWYNLVLRKGPAGSYHVLARSRGNKG